MKRLLIALAVAFALAGPALAVENCSRTGSSEVRPVCIALDSANGITTSAWVQTSAFSAPSVQIQGNGGVSSITIECRTSPSMNPFPCTPGSTPIVNVDSTGVYITLPRSSWYRINQTACTACLTNANFELFK